MTEHNETEAHDKFNTTTIFDLITERDKIMADMADVLFEETPFCLKDGFEEACIQYIEDGAGIFLMDVLNSWDVEPQQHSFFPQLIEAIGYPRFLEATYTKCRYFDVSNELPEAMLKELEQDFMRNPDDYDPESMCGQVPSLKVVQDYYTGEGIFIEDQAYHDKEYVLDFMVKQPAQREMAYEVLQRACDYPFDEDFATRFASVLPDMPEAFMQAKKEKEHELYIHELCDCDDVSEGEDDDPFFPGRSYNSTFRSLPPVFEVTRLRRY